MKIRNGKIGRVGTAVLLCGAASVGYAEDTIITDRPDFVESSATVGKGRFQVETSVNLERDKTDAEKVRAYATPTLFRFGFSEDWEVRLETDGRIRERVQDRTTGETVTTRGNADISLGLKWHTRDGDEATRKPAIGWLLHADVPSGSDEFEGHGIRPSLRVVAEWELPNDWGLGIMPGVIYDTDAQERRFFAGLLGIVLGKGWTEQFRTFVEVAGQQLASNGHGGSIVTYNFGAAYLLSRDWQVDTAVSLGANERSPDFSWTLGLSARF